MTEKVVLITGGAGFIGSHLSDHFLGKGYRVVCVDNFITGSRNNIQHLAGNKNFKLLEQNISDYIEYPDAVDYILHFASPASPIDYLQHPIPTLKVGALGTHNALGLAKAKKATLLLASTSEVYGDPLVHPQKEDYWGNVNPVGPRGVYDEAKRFAEAITMAYHNAHGLNTKIIRIFNTYGPRMRLRDGRAIPEFINAALSGQSIPVFGNGSQTRSFCYVSDLVAGIEKVLLSDLNTPVNLGNPNEMTILQLAETIIRMIGSASKIEYKPLPVDDPKIRQPDITRAKEKLGWSPKVPLEEGLKTTIEYFRQSLQQTTKR
ncbi:MAG TPA: UDP-glucuronic acid decarboxylase family protein [Verrucomicrobiae bacterium]|jgi:dTDP-glucose 4,6-dehydratase|nr:UDP-glucuronic acid decarboxylase family protein [Verrucomicrobiae bacterium]